MKRDDFRRAGLDDDDMRDLSRAFDAYRRLKELKQDLATREQRFRARRRWAPHAHGASGEEF